MSAVPRNRTVRIRHVFAELRDGSTQLIRSMEVLTDPARPTTPAGAAAPRRGESPRETVAVPISLLVPGESPRLEGQDEAHVERLAEIDRPLPPILVDRRSMQVIDGTHRLMAAVLKGRETIEVEFYDGTPEDAFLRAVEANVTHGFPLSQADRRAAAARITKSHPYMSDRAIAQVVGLAAKTVASIRRDLEDESVTMLTRRIGRDGRTRPLSSVEGRRRVAELMAERPHASLREVARTAGVSPATASDVRKRLQRGEEPVPSSADRPKPRIAAEPPDPASVLEKLLRDPSLRHNEEGRRLLHMLRTSTLGATKLSELACAMPPHCTTLVRELARHYAQLWSEFDRELDERTRTATTVSAVTVSTASTAA